MEEHNSQNYQSNQEQDNSSPPVQQISQQQQTESTNEVQTASVATQSTVEENQEFQTTSSSFSNFANSITNQIFLSDQHLQQLYQLLALDYQSQFENFESSDPDLNVKFEEIIQNSENSFQNEFVSNLEEISNNFFEYDVNNLERFMCILKSKKRALYIQKIQVTKTNEEPSLLNQQILMNDIKEFSNLTNFNQKFLEMFDSQTNSLIFNMNNRYKIILKSLEKKSIDNHSLLRKIPRNLFLSNIFICFSAYELFKLRGGQNQFFLYNFNFWRSVS